MLWVILFCWDAFSSSFQNSSVGNGLDLGWVRLDFEDSRLGCTRAELFVSLFPHGCFIFNCQDWISQKDCILTDNRILNLSDRFPQWSLFFQNPQRAGWLSEQMCWEQVLHAAHLLSQASVSPPCPPLGGGGQANQRSLSGILSELQKADSWKVSSAFCALKGHV